MNRPYKNPNRWMINHVPVMQVKPLFDYWLCAVAIIASICVPAGIVLALYL